MQRTHDKKPEMAVNSCQYDAKIHTHYLPQLFAQGQKRSVSNYIFCLIMHDVCTAKENLVVYELKFIAAFIVSNNLYHCNIYKLEIDFFALHNLMINTC